MKVSMKAKTKGLAQTWRGQAKELEAAGREALRDAARLRAAAREADPRKRKVGQR